MKAKGKKSAALRDVAKITSRSSKQENVDRLRPNLRSALKASNQNVIEAGLRRCTVLLNRVTTPPMVRKNTDSGPVEKSGDKQLTSTVANNAPNKENVYNFDDVSDCGLDENRSNPDDSMQDWIREMHEKKKITLARHRRIGGVKRPKLAIPRKKREPKAAKSKTKDIAVTTREASASMELPVTVNSVEMTNEQQPSIENAIESVEVPLNRGITLRPRKNALPPIKTVATPVNSGSVTGVRSVDGTNETTEENQQPAQMNIRKLKNSCLTNRVSVQLSRPSPGKVALSPRHQEPIVTRDVSVRLTRLDANMMTKRKKVLIPLEQSTPLLKKTRSNRVVESSDIISLDIRSFMDKETSLASIYDDPKPSTSTAMDDEILSFPSPSVNDNEAVQQPKRVSFNLVDDFNEVPDFFGLDIDTALQDDNEQLPFQSENTPPSAIQDDKLAENTGSYENRSNISLFFGTPSPPAIAKKRDYTRSPLKAITNLNSPSKIPTARKSLNISQSFTSATNRKPQSSPLPVAHRKAMSKDLFSNSFNQTDIASMLDQTVINDVTPGKTVIRPTRTSKIDETSINNLFGFDEEDEEWIASDTENDEKKKKNKLTRIKMDALCQKKTVLKMIEKVNQEDPLLVVPIMSTKRRTPKKAAKLVSPQKQPSLPSPSSIHNVFGRSEKLQRDIRTAFSSNSPKCSTETGTRHKASNQRDPSPIIFRDLENDRRKSYNGPQQYRKRLSSHNSEDSDSDHYGKDEADVGVANKKRKKKKKKKLFDTDKLKDQTELNKYCEEFNAICDEVDSFDMRRECA